MLTNRGDYATAFAKGVLCFLIGFLTWQWHLALHRWAAELLYLGPQLPLYDALLAIGTLTACLAVLMLTQQNAQRVTMNTLLILACTFVGMLFGDPQCRGSYDHLGGGETVQGWLTFGILGALIGYLWTQGREVNRLARPPDGPPPR